MSDKLKVLLVGNIIPQIFAKQLGVSVSYGGGWIDGILKQLINVQDLEIGYCTPYKSESDIVHLCNNNVKFWGINKEKWMPHKYDKSVERKFRVVLNSFQPDIVHIFGTEFPHTLAMIKAFNNPDRTVIHLQGIISEIAKVYTAYLPKRVIHKYTFRDFLRQDNIYQQARKFSKRGIYEIEAIRSVKHVMGRTQWDKEWIEKIHPNAKYYYCPERLRDAFYCEQSWELSICEEYSIFISQADYPIKGLHLALNAIKEVKKKCPNVKAYIAGTNMQRDYSWQDKFRQGTYTKYIRKQICGLNLSENIAFLGMLSAEEMKARMLKCHLYLLPSVIENSSNSLMEAMILGVPVIAANVGGISSLIEDNEEGMLYQVDNTEQLVEKILLAFRNKHLIKRYSNASKVRMKNMNEKKSDIDILMKIYDEICELCYT